MGAQSQIDSGVDGLVSLLEEIQEGLAKMREPLAHVGALDGLVDLIRPLIESVSEAGGDLTQDLEGMGLGGLGDVVEPVLAVGPRALDAAGAFIDAAPDRDSVTNLQQEISQFGETIRQFKEINGASE